MARFGSIGTQYFDNDGRVLSDGRLYFFVTNTTTPLTTYSDSAQTIANTHPVELDASGRQPNIFFTGVAKCELRDSVDALIEVRDPVGVITVSGEFATWSSGTVYSERQFTTGSDGNTYQSVGDSNIGNDPTTSPNEWQRVLIIGQWNPDFTYQTGDMVFRTGLGPNAIFVCAVPTSINDAPDVGSLEWSNAVAELDDPIFYAYQEHAIALTDAATTNIDTSLASQFSWTLGGNRTANIQNMVEGRSALINVAATTFTIDWTGNSITWIGGTAPLLSPSARTIIQIWQDNIGRYGTLVGYT
jgi:hypothetical protein